MLLLLDPIDIFLYIFVFAFIAGRISAGRTRRVRSDLRQLPSNALSG